MPKFQSEETRNKISDSLMGHPMADKARLKLKPFLGGHVPWNKGKEHSKETKRKISNTLKRRKIEPKVKFKSHRGNKNPRWNGGTVNYWKKQVLTRDDYTCQICGHREPEIMEVDHIKPKSKFPNLAKELSNLLTLCPNCHRRKTNREKKALKI